MLYISIMVCIVGAALAWVALYLKPKQDDNVRIDKMQQMLNSLHIASTEDNAIELYSKYITDSYIINNKGEKLDGEAFGIDMANEIKKPIDERNLPVFKCTIDNSIKYILPVYGNGLWGPIWGYVAVDDDGSTIYGTYFSHKSETPGLGAEIANERFSSQFNGKHLFKDNQFKSIAVLKKGQKVNNGEDYVDAISGGTITSKGVQSMLDSCLSGYSVFLNELQSNNQ